MGGLLKKTLKVFANAFLLSRNCDCENFNRVFDFSFYYCHEAPFGNLHFVRKFIFVYVLMYSFFYVCFFKFISNRLQRGAVMPCAYPDARYP